MTGTVTVRVLFLTGNNPEGHQQKNPNQSLAMSGSQ